MSDIKSLKRALNILNCFTFDVPEQRVSEIAQRLGMTKSTVYRVLSTFSSANILVKSPNTQKYRLGPKILELAGTFLSKADLRTIALPHLEELRKRTDETVSIFVIDGDQRVCLDRLESSQGIRDVINVGERLPLHAGSAGKLLLAYMPKEKRDKLMEKIGLHQFTPHTIKNREELEKELENIRRDDLAVSFQERELLAVSASVPIKNYKGEVIAACSMSGPIMRLTSSKVREHVIVLRDTANKISRELGYKGT